MICEMFYALFLYDNLLCFMVIYFQTHQIHSLSDVTNQLENKYHNNT